MKGTITTDPYMVVEGYFELYTHTFDNLNETDQFFEKIISQTQTIDEHKENKSITFQNKMYGPYGFIKEPQKQIQKSSAKY